MKKFAFSLFVIFSTTYLYAQQNVEEVIVTATKTEKTLQEVPVAVSVVTADTIEKANITDIYDLRSIVPALDSRRFTTPTEATYVIRGFGNGSFNPGIEPSVAVFIDGVYRSSMQAQIADLPAIERIEVLRGPQSTLFGKNATAGVINVVTKKPSFDESGYVSTSIGSNNMKKFKYYKTGPLDDSKAYSFYANLHKADGHSDNMTTGNTSNNRDRFSVRGEMLFDLANEASLRLTVDYDEYDEICCAVGSANYGAANQVAALLGGKVIPNNPFTEKVFFDFDPVSEGDNSGVTVHYTKEGDGTTLESITSIRNSYNTNVQDVDFDAAPIVNPSPQTKELDAVTQEFRLYSNDNEKLNWLVGGYYYQEDLDWDESIYFGPLWRTYVEAFIPPGTISGIAAAFGIPDALLFANGQGGTETATQDNTTTSIFAQVDIQLTDKLSAIIGASYMEDEKTVAYSQINTDVLSNLDFVGAGTLGLIAAGFPPAQAAALATDPNFNPLIALQGLQLLPQFTNFPNAAQDGKSSDDNVDYTFKLSYEVSDTVTVYGGVSTGFKASAWNISRNSDADAAEVAALAAAGTPVSPNRSVGRRYAGPEEAGGHRCCPPPPRAVRRRCPARRRRTLRARNSLSSRRGFCASKARQRCRSCCANARGKRGRHWTWTCLRKGARRLGAQGRTILASHGGELLHGRLQLTVHHDPLADVGRPRKARRVLRHEERADGCGGAQDGQLLHRPHELHFPDRVLSAAIW